MQGGVSGLKRKASQMSGASFGSAVSRGSNASKASADSKVHKTTDCQTCLINSRLALHVLAATAFMHVSLQDVDDRRLHNLMGD